MVGIPCLQRNFGDDFGHSATELEVFAVAHLPNASTIHSDFVLEHDWITEQATLPVNLTVRNVANIGKMALSISMGVDRFSEANGKFGPETRITVNVLPERDNIHSQCHSAAGSMSPRHCFHSLLCSSVNR